MRRRKSVQFSEDSEQDITKDKQSARNVNEDNLGQCNLIHWMTKFLAPLITTEDSQQFSPSKFQSVYRSKSEELVKETPMKDEEAMQVSEAQAQSACKTLLISNRLYQTPRWRLHLKCRLHLYLPK